MNRLNLAEEYKNNKIGINLFRYVLALLVILDHSYHMGGFGEEPLIFSFGGKTTVGFLAVGAFFSISGFLITNAALNSDPLKFFLNRFLRIWPALIFLLLVSALIIGPIIVHFSDGSLRNYALNFNSIGPWTYIFHNIFLVVELQYNLLTEISNETFYGLSNLLEINLENNNATFGGSVTATGDVAAYSDIKLKSNIETIKDALLKISQILSLLKTL